MLYTPQSPLVQVSGQVVVKVWTEKRYDKTAIDIKIGYFNRSILEQRKL